MYKYTNIQIFKYTNSQIHKYANTSVRLPAVRVRVRVRLCGCECECVGVGVGFVCVREKECVFTWMIRLLMSRVGRGSAVCV